MPGIVFFKTTMLNRIVEFYTKEIGMTVWLKQADCIILRFENMLVGFCQRDSGECEGLITFDYDSKDHVNEIYEKFKDIATEPPRENEKYQIYNFFAQDPEGRNIEFQTFLHEVEPIQ
ncbi:MAG: VOC family protein [Candidatus Thorarchaeota archaeon]